MRPALFLVLLLIGCDAGYQDLRPAGTIKPPDPGLPNLPSQEGRVVATGTWSGRGDYRGFGQVTQFLRDDGQYELQFSEDFQVSRVPGPVVVVSRRDVLGNRLDPDQDIELGTLAANQGAQSYLLPPGADDRRYIWVFCKPFGLEVARAPLETP